MTANFQFADQLDVAGKTVLLRLDVNVPLADGVVSDDTRIRRVMPGVQSLLVRGAKVVVLTHFGRPKGAFVPALTVRPVAQSMAGILGQPVPVESDVIGPGGKKAVAALAGGDILMMENLRFYPEEEANDLAFAKSLAALGDLYVGDAFSCAHRAHASVDALPRLMPSAAGRSFAAELAALDAALSSPVRPLGAVVGGAKVSSKLALLENLVTQVDGLVLGGGWPIHFCWRKVSQLAPRLPNLTWSIRRAGLWMVLPRIIARFCFPKMWLSRVNLNLVPRIALSAVTMLPMAK